MKTKNIELFKFYFSTETKRNITKKLKMICMLIPVFSIILLFATIQDLPSLNQKIYLSKCTYSNMAFSDVDKSKSFKYLDASVISSEKHGGNLYYINLIMNEKNLDLDNTLLSRSNLIASEGGNLKNNGLSEIMLSYNALRSLNVKIGDTISLLINKKNKNSSINIKCKVTGYYRPFYGNMYKNNFDISYGLAYGKLNDEDIKKIYGNSTWRYLTFDSDEIDNDDYIIEKSSQRRSETKASNKEYYFFLLVFPMMSIVLVFVVIKSEFKYMLKRNKRTYSIYNLMGITKKQLLDIYVFEFLFSIIISSIIAAILYKYVLMKYYIKQFVPTVVFLGSIGICIIIGYFVTKICIESIEKKNKSTSLLEGANGKE